MSMVRLLKNGSEAFPVMLDAIEAARSCIALEMYIFQDDETGLAFREALIDAAKRGLEVMVLVDAVGSWMLTDAYWDGLRQAGGSIRWFRPIRKGLLPFRDHRKLLLIDDRVAFIGGLNIGDEYHQGRDGEPPWRDNALQVEGTEVARLRRSFMRMWSRALKPLRLRFLMRRRPGREHAVGPIGGRRVRFLESGPEDPVQPVRRAYGRLVRRARERIDLAMAYFFPSGKMMRALKRAVRRGVRVRLLLPSRTDVPIARWAARGLYGRLLRTGIEVWEYQPAMLHAKLAIVDSTVIAGSANLDLRSARINYELVAAATDPDLAARAAADFEQDLKESTRISLDDWRRRPFIQKIKERVSYWLVARADLFVARTRLVMSRW